MKFALRLLAPLGMMAAWPAQAAMLDIRPLYPAHYHELSSAEVGPPSAKTHFHVVALARDDQGGPFDEAPAAARPLLIFKVVGDHARLVARNDHVVLRADEGGQCDPFTDADRPIAAKGRYFTVENGVACGNHWTDYITFRFDDRSGEFVFDNERSENWVFNKSDDPNAEALARDGPQTVRRPKPGRSVTFSDWRPSR